MDMKQPKMKPIDSSMIDTIGYEDEVLWIVFTSGKCYVYAGVPEEIFNDMMNAESIGKFFHGHIKNNYEAILHNPEL